MRVLSLLWALPVVCLAGCGIGPVDRSISAPHALVASGSVHGGEAPIVFSKVSFYETATTGVATKGVYVPPTPTTELGSTYTDKNGNFSFATPLHCSNSNNFVYAVAAGGNTGSYAGTLNANALEMASVGSCSGFGGSTFVVINEVSTVAAGYSLSGFTSLSGSYTTATGAPLTVAVVSNPAGNSVSFNVTNSVISGQPITVTGCTGGIFNGAYTVATATPTTITVNTSRTGTDTNCTVTPIVVASVPVVSVTATATNFAPSGTGTPTSAAGLNHAFANAATLATLGVANTVIAGSTAGTTVLPTTMVNELADVLQSCVNSTGGTATSATANDGSNCGKLFSYTTDVSGSSPVVPANTLQAALTMAHFPTKNVANIVGLVPAMAAAFQPVPTNTPSDLSLAIVYGAGFGAPAGSGAGLNAPYVLSLDANDNVYLQNGVYDTQGNFGGNVLGFTNQGETLWASPVAAPISLGGLITDTFGNLFVVTGVNNQGAVDEYLAATGGFEQRVRQPNGAYLAGIAADATGNLFVQDYNLYGAFGLIGRTGGAGAGTFSADYIARPTGDGAGGFLQIAKDGTVFFLGYDNSTGAYEVAGLPYTGSTAPYTAHPVFAAGSGTANSNDGVSAVAQDAGGRVWGINGNFITPYTPTYSNGLLNGFVAGSSAKFEANDASVSSMLLDGGGTAWAADYNGFLVQYTDSAANPAAATLNPCVANTNRACVATLDGANNSPYQLAGDSAGSLWIANESTVLQVIGSAAPMWPQGAEQKPGQMP